MKPPMMVEYAIPGNADLEIRLLDHRQACIVRECSEESSLLQ